MEQIREPDPRYQIGAGKVEELARLVKQKNADKVIFDNLLKPVQLYNLAKATHIENADRFELILEIFTKRAATTEAKMQIKLAKLQRNLARAKEMVRLAKKGEQPGFMGLGAYEVDVYHESIKKEVHTIRRKLKKIRRKRALHRRRRAELGFSSISLAGYTHAGKSSLFNAFTEEKVPVDSKLFTTISTTTRLVEFYGKRFLLTDTVGFIDRLPIALVEAFHSTLEETIHSDLILLIVDVSEQLPVVEKKLGVCLETIERIDASGIPIITVLNKIDLLSAEELQKRINGLKGVALNVVPISALCGTNLDLLKQNVLSLLRTHIRASFTIPLTNGTMPFVSSVFKKADVQRVEYTQNSAHVVFEGSPSFVEKVRRQVSKLNGNFHAN